MIENTKCECGHQNHIGTVLCEACGKPLGGLQEADNAPLEMRYDGTARRSQKSNPGVLDRIWNFFSSVKIAVYLIIITLVCAMIGTIFPQVNVIPAFDKLQYYRDTYGVVGEIYYRIGFADTFGAWWFKILVLMIAASLVICSLDRVVPLYRALRKQKAAKHERFLNRQRVVYSGELNGQPQAWLEQAEKVLRAKRYKITKEETKDGQALLAEKNRFSRWGPYINHVGLIIFILAILTRGIPGWYMAENVSVNEGEIVQIQGTNLFLENIKFTETVPAKENISGAEREIAHETEAILYRCTADCNNPLVDPQLEELEHYTIRPNHPLMYDDYSIYQIGYTFNPLATGITYNLQLRDGEDIGEFKVDLKDPKTEYLVGDYRIDLTGYYPDLISKGGQPATNSSIPKNPAFIFVITGPNNEAEPYFVSPFDQFQKLLTNDDDNKGSIQFSIAKMEGSLYMSHVLVRIEKAVPFLFGGAMIFLIGVVMGLYWQHRRIWIRLEGQQLLLAAHTNKNWFGLREEIAASLNKLGIEVSAKSLANEVKKA